VTCRGPADRRLSQKRSVVRKVKRAGSPAKGGEITAKELGSMSTVVRKATNRRQENLMNSQNNKFFKNITFVKADRGGARSTDRPHFSLNEDPARKKSRKRLRAINKYSLRRKGVTCPECGKVGHECIRHMSIGTTPKTYEKATG